MNKISEHGIKAMSQLASKMPQSDCKGAFKMVTIAIVGCYIIHKISLC